MSQSQHEAIEAVAEALMQNDEKYKEREWLFLGDYVRNLLVMLSFTYPIQDLVADALASQAGEHRQ